MFFGMQHKVFVHALGGVLFLVAATVQAAEPSVADLIKASKSGDEPARIKAIEQLGAKRQAAAEAVEPLTQILGDKSAMIRAHAAHALGRIGEPAKSAVAPLSELVKDGNATVRQQTVKAILAIHPGPKIMLPLFIKLMEDSDSGVQMRILNAVSDAGAAAVPGVIAALDNPKTAYWACIVLRGMGPVGKDAVPALAKTLTDPQPDIRREAALALGAMGEAAASAAPQLGAVLEDEHAQTAATFALGQIGQIPAGAEAKIKANTKSKDDFLSTVSYWTLARVHPENKELRREATERLVARIMDKDPFVRVAAARGLAALPPAPEITLPILEKALKDADETTAHYALDALATLGPAAVPRLLDALKHKQLRGQVIYVLGQIGPKAAPATEALAKLLRDDDSRVAIESAIALGKIGPEAKSAVPALVAALQQKECSNAHAIIFALGRIGPSASAAEPKLLELTKSPDHTLAIPSAWAITQLHPGSAEIVAKVSPVIVAGLADPLAESREAAAEALGSLGPLAKGSIPALEKATKDEQKSVREAATEALQAIRSPAKK
jgi:HEAT repeat protein